MKKKRIVSALMSMAMCVSALPMSVYAESDTTAELPEFTRKFRDEMLLNPEESEENRLIHNIYSSLYDDEAVFLGSRYTTEVYYWQYPHNKAITVPGHDDIKCVQYICKDNYLYMYNYIDNPYITKEEYNVLNYNERLITAGKIFEETGEYIASMISNESDMVPCYYVGEDGWGYNRNGDAWIVFDGKVMSAYCNPEELNICDGKSVYKYSDVYDGDPDNALTEDFYKYLEDNNVKQVFEGGEFGNKRIYYGIDNYWLEHSYVEDLSAETFITDLDGNVIPNDPNLLRIISLFRDSPVYAYKKDGRYIFESDQGNRIVFSSFDESENSDNDDSYPLMDFFNDHAIYEEYYSIDHVIETYLADEDKLTIYNKNVLTGDANEDGDISLADAVLIMQSLSNPDEFALTEQGAINADYNGDGSVSTADALEIQVFCIS